MSKVDFAIKRKAPEYYNSLKEINVAIIKHFHQIANGIEYHDEDAKKLFRIHEVWMGKGLTTTKKPGS